MAYKPERKINRLKMNKMVMEGKSGVEIAKYFGVSPGAVSKAKKELRADTSREIALEATHLVTTKTIDTMGQLSKINEYANELLDLLIRWNRGEKVALQVLESQMTERHVRIGDNDEIVKEYKFKDPRELTVKVMTEIRGQLKLQFEMLQALYDMEAVQEFQTEVLEVIASVSKEARDQIIQRLQDRRIIRGAVSVSN